MTDRPEDFDAPGEDEKRIAKLSAARPELGREAEERIRRRVLADAAARWRPRNVRSLVVAYGLLGALLIGLGALGVAHVGPLAF
jgi:hypothetical protein